MFLSSFPYTYDLQIGFGPTILALFNFINLIKHLRTFHLVTGYKFTNLTLLSNCFHNATYYGTQFALTKVALTRSSATEYLKKTPLVKTRPVSPNCLISA